MLTEFNNLIEDKAKELNIKIKSHIINKYNLIYIKVLRGSKEKRKEFKEWIDNSRPLKVQIQIKQTNEFKELVRMLTSRDSIDMVIGIIFALSILTGEYTTSVLALKFMAIMIVRDVVTSLSRGVRQP